MTLNERVKALSPERAEIIVALVDHLLLLPQDQPEHPQSASGDDPKAVELDHQMSSRREG